jgi:branched-chain amino acid transport system ATP-binding protein
MTLLKVEKINTFYGPSHILFDVSLDVNEGETVAILGRNGVGKTTTLRSIMGLEKPHSGSIEFHGKEIIGIQPHQIARSGIGMVPEDRKIFPDLTVLENLKMGDRGDGDIERIFDLFPKLRERGAQNGGTLSGGEQQMLTIARTLMGNPKLLLLDEPSEGLAPVIVQDVGRQLRRLKDDGMTILISEQNSAFTLKYSDRAFILEKGSVCWHGDAAELRNNTEILGKYLGV